MTSRKISRTFAGGLVVALLLLASLPSFAGPIVSGTYKITATTDLDTQVRLTLELHFVNADSTPVTITKIGLRNFSRLEPANLLVSAHGTAQLVVDFTLTKQDYNVWHRGPHQFFIINFQPSVGQAGVALVPLLRTQG